MKHQALAAAKKEIHALRNQLQEQAYHVDRQTQLANSLASELETTRAKLKHCVRRWANARARNKTGATA